MAARVGSGCSGAGKIKPIRSKLTANLRFSRKLLAEHENLHEWSKDHLQRAQGLVVDGLTEAWGVFTAKHHDPHQHEPQVLPDFAMNLRHLYCSVILLPHPDDADRFVHFLATDHMSKLQMARRPGVTAPYFEWILMRQKPDRFARPLWHHLGLELAPPADPGV